MPSGLELVAQANAAKVGNMAALRARREPWTVVVFAKDGSKALDTFGFKTLGECRRFIDHGIDAHYDRDENQVGKTHVYDNSLKLRVL